MPDRLRPSQLPPPLRDPVIERQKAPRGLPRYRFRKESVVGNSHVVDLGVVHKTAQSVLIGKSALFRSHAADQHPRPVDGFDNDKPGHGRTTALQPNGDTVRKVRAERMTTYDERSTRGALDLVGIGIE